MFIEGIIEKMPKDLSGEGKGHAVSILKEEQICKGPVAETCLVCSEAVRKLCGQGGVSQGGTGDGCREAEGSQIVKLL